MIGQEPLNASVVEPLPPSQASNRFNNLDIMRLAAAILVIFSHAFPIVGLSEPQSFLNPTRHSWGSLGVLVFFSISGYLIAGSWLKEPSIKRYWMKRSLRILPGLVVATVISAWVIGPAVTTSTMGEYFTSAGTWLYPLQESLLFLPPWFEPPAVFSGQPMSDINASLWTLPVEVLCYLGLMMMFILRLNKTIIIICSTAVLALLGSTELLAVAGINLPLTGLMAQAATFGATFLAGSALYLWRDKLRLSLLWAAVALGIALVLRETPLGTFVTPFLVPYVILTLGLKAPVLPTGKLRGWDLSYGTYVFAFPIEQCVLAYTGTSNPWVVGIISAAIVLPLAALSWRFVERPALSLIPKRTRIELPATNPV